MWGGRFGPCTVLAHCLQSLAVLQVYGIDAADGEDSIVRIVARLSICAVVSHSERQVLSQPIDCATKQTKGRLTDGAHRGWQQKR